MSTTPSVNVLSHTLTLYLSVICGNLLSCVSGVSSMGKGPSDVFIDVITELFVSSAMSNSSGLSVALKLGVASDEAEVIAAGVALSGQVACTSVVTGEVRTCCLGLVS